LTLFDVLSVKIGATKNPQTKKIEKNEKRSRVKTLSPKTPERIVMTFCLMVAYTDIVISAKLGDDRFSHLCTVSGQFLGFPINFGCLPYNTLALP